MPKTTKKTAAKKKAVKRTTSKDVPGSGLAQKAARGLEARKRLLQSI